MTAVETRSPEPSPGPGADTEWAPVKPSRRTGVLSGGWTRSAGLLVAVVLLVVVCFVSLAVGSKPMPLSAVWDAIFHFDGTIDNHLIVRDLRLPRTMVGLLVGIALGLAGAVMQGVTRNPLADPGILGVDAGAALAVVIAINSFGITSFTGYIWFAFVGAGVASVVVYLLGSLGRAGATPVKLALAGAALSALFSSFTSAILLLDIATLDQFRFWAVGSLVGRDMEVVAQVVPFILVGTVLALSTARSLNTLAMGDDVARSLGQRVGMARATSALAVILLAGAATAIAGPIGFVGLTIPHVARAITGPDYKWVLPWSLVLAPLLLLTSDVVGRVIARPGEIQVGIITAFVGAPFFIMLVRRRKLAEL